MPIVNRSIYIRCSGCNRWMLRLPFNNYIPESQNGGLSGGLDGNRMHICQECYERADRQPQKVQAKEFATGIDGRIRHINAPQDCQCYLCVANQRLDARDGKNGKSEAYKKTIHRVTCSLLNGGTSCDCGCGQTVSEFTTSSTKDMHIDPPTESELLEIFRQARRRGFFDGRDELDFAIKAFIALRIKKP